MMILMIRAKTMKMMPKMIRMKKKRRNMKRKMRIKPNLKRHDPNHQMTMKLLSLNEPRRTFRRGRSQPKKKTRQGMREDEETPRRLGGTQTKGRRG